MDVYTEEKEGLSFFQGLGNMKFPYSKMFMQLKSEEILAVR